MENVRGTLRNGVLHRVAEFSRNVYRQHKKSLRYIICCWKSRFSDTIATVSLSTAPGPYQQVLVSLVRVTSPMFSGTGVYRHAKTCRPNVWQPFNYSNTQSCAAK